MEMLKKQNFDYQQMILKFEEQSKFKEKEWNQMQEAVRHKVEA